LKTQAKKRGYVERQEFAVNDQRPDFSELTTEEIKRLLNENEEG
jgi:predicted phosphoribosyltransferase